jgi:glycosyltransferase involved in cell wall biosynthesis
MKVVFFHRKPRPKVFFSIENIFHFIRQELPADIQWEVKELRYYSEGLLKRLYISLEAAINQGDVNHITGDIHFIALFLRGKKTVLTIHDIGFMQHPNRWYRLLLKLFWITWPVRRAAIITTVSESTKRELLKYNAIDPLKIKVVYNPINSLFIPFPKPFNKHKPRILQIGTTPNKNIVRLAQALKSINCTLEVIGKMQEELQAELKKTGIDYCFSSDLSNAEIVEKYRSADVLAFVSTYEGFGMPIVEANATGRVVITSNILSMPEIAGNAAHLVDPFDVDAIRTGILKVIEDDVYREQLIVNGFENRKRFDVKQIAKEYTQLYTSLHRNNE